MKKTQHGFIGIAIIIIIAVALIAGGTYVYSTKNNSDTDESVLNTDTSTTDTTVPATTSVSINAKLDGKNIVQTSAHSEVEQSIISKGTYVYEDSSGTQFTLKVIDTTKAHLTILGRMVYEQYNLTYTTKPGRVNFFFNSYDLSDEAANLYDGMDKKFNKDEEMFVLDVQSNSTFKATWGKPTLWLNNVSADQGNGLFMKK